MTNTTPKAPGEANFAQATPVALKVEDLVVRYPVRDGILEAVSGVSFEVAQGETLGLVGESGCGKSSTGRAIMQVPPPTSGRVELGSQDLTKLPADQLRLVRRRMQMIFQDPVSALNSRRRIRKIVGEGLAIAGESRSVIEQRVEETLTLIGMDVDAIGDRRAHELSGGQCQRIAIARALVLSPELLVCDEPVASLDVSVQGQVLNLLEDMRTELGLSMLFISHDLSVVHNISDRIAVMYLGRLVEIGDSNAVTRTPAHPYTRALLDAVPMRKADPGSQESLRGEIPSPMSPPSGCRFRTRCPLAQERCATDVPELREVSPAHRVACHFPLVAEASAA